MYYINYDISLEKIVGRYTNNILLSMMGIIENRI